MPVEAGARSVDPQHNIDDDLECVGQPTSAFAIGRNVGKKDSVPPAADPGVADVRDLRSRLLAHDARRPAYTR